MSTLELRSVELSSTDLQDEEAPRLFNEAAELDIIKRVKNICGPDGAIFLQIQSWWGGGQRWARNRATMTSDQRDVWITAGINKRGETVSTLSFNQSDDGSLKNALDVLEQKYAGVTFNEPPMKVEGPLFPSKGISVWSDSTFNRTAEDNGRAVQYLTERAESEGLLSAGFIGTTGSRIVKYSRDIFGQEYFKKGHATEIQCSCTVRHPRGTGSGWAGNSSFELQRVNMNKIAEIAFEKCMKSLDPVRIEPGRYQTILEPQATEVFASMLFSTLYSRKDNEESPNWLTLGYDSSLRRYRTKIGFKIIDERINIHHDPEDALSGTHPDVGMDSVDVVKNGVLMTMLSDYTYVQREHHRTRFDAKRRSFVMDGGNTSIDEMISTMKRGLLVTTLSDANILHPSSLLMTGLTRNGLWLVEDGKISKAVRNFRWTESPLFIFNNVADIGEAVPVFTPGTWMFPFQKGYNDVVQSVVVPAMKINDFSFTSTVDAI